MALILLMCIDYITGVCVAIRKKELSSKIGTKGLATKIMIFSVVGLSVLIDRLLIGEGHTISSMTTLFYCSNELISICENASRMGVPLPKKLTEYLKVLHEKEPADNSKTK